MKSLFRKYAFIAIPLVSLVAVTGCDDEALEAGKFAKPVIVDVTPGAALIGTQVTINGTGLGKVTRVEFASFAASSFTANDESITVTVPQGLAEGPLLLSVYYPGASENNLGPSDNVEFTVLYAPVISSLSVAQAKPTKQVTITGTSLAGATSVKFGDVAAAFEADATTIVATVPDIDTPGETQITVTTPGGTASVPFTVLAKVPEVHSFTPVEGKAGVQITVNGLFFEDVQSVKIGETTVANYTVVGPTQITFNIPQGATTGKIIVTTDIGTGESASSLNVIQSLPLPYTIYTDELNSTWQKWGGWGTSTQEMASTEQPKTGTNAIKVTYSDGYGGFQLHPTNPDPFKLEDVSKVKLSIYGGANAGGKKVVLYIKNKAGQESTKVELTLAADAYTSFEVTKAQLGNPADINEFVIQNWGTANITIYIDDISLE
ncbi:MAG TPA: IPT/TIG domain-containing protein [Chryseosolibacter sp.]|nr:IPT/TIG domain-containing protein [Chryseosolibacter sp.]